MPSSGAEQSLFVVAVGAVSTVAALPFGDVERDVGRAQQRRGIRIGWFFGNRGDAQADGCAYRVSAEVDCMLGNALPYAFSYGSVRRFTDSGQSDGEFVAAEAGEQIFFAQVLLRHARQVQQPMGRAS